MPQPSTPATPPSRGRHFWPLWLAAVLLPAAALALGAWLTWGDVRAEARGRVARIADMLHAQALRAFETQEALIAAVDARMEGMGWEEIAASADLHRFINRLDQSTPFVAGIGLVDPEGRMVMISSSGHFPIRPIDMRDRDYVRAFQGAPPQGGFVGAPVVSRPSGTVIFPVVRARGAGGGLLASSFEAAAFTAFYAAIAEAPGDSVTLLRLDGTILARHPGDASPAPRLPADAPVLRAARDEGRDRGVVEVRSAIDGVVRLNGFRRVEGYPVVVVYGMAPDGLRAAWWERVRLLGGVATVAMLLLLGLTWMAARAAGREARALAAAAEEAGHARQEAERRAEAEARLRRSERSAALGQIAAGVAHDMNNLVQSVVAAAQLLDRRAENPAEVRRLAGMVREASARGARLARRMLEFGRAAPEAGERFEIGATLGGLEALLGGLLGGGVRLVVEAPPGLPPVLADRREFETVLVNLVVNARDAMPKGGVVTVSAAPEPAPEAMPPRRAGGFLRIAVRDDGEGMPPEVLARAGEPFFTTKPAEKGTGLGLTMARQFAERSGGAMRIESAPGSGTSVTLWLPAAAAAATAA